MSYVDVLFYQITQLHTSLKKNFDNKTVTNSSKTMKNIIN